MAAFVLQPHVAEFLDVVMHDRSLEIRVEEVVVPEGSPVAGATMGDSGIRDRSGALVVALRAADGTFRTNPPLDARIGPGEVIIAVGTQDELDELARHVRPGGAPR